MGFIKVTGGMSFFPWAGKLQSDASGSLLDDC